MSAEFPVILSAIAGSATGIGGLAVFLLPTLPPDRIISLSLSVAAGVMICVSLFDLYLPYAVKSFSSFLFASLCFAGGAAACKLISRLPFPEPEDLAMRFVRTDVENQHGADDVRDVKRREAWRLGATLALVLTLHNLPEGVAVGLSTVKSEALGIVLAIAIFVHNLAEGFVVAVPVLAGTGSRTLALVITILSGSSEPLGALLGIMILRSWAVSAAVEVALCAVAGVMTAVSIKDLLPQARLYGSDRLVVVGALGGAMVIGLTLPLL